VEVPQYCQFIAKDITKLLPALLSFVLYWFIHNFAHLSCENLSILSSALSSQPENLFFHAGKVMGTEPFCG